MAKTKKSHELVGFGTRFLAMLIDAIILGVGTAVLSRVLIFPPFGRGIMKNFNFLIGPAYSILLWVNWNGQTIGKKILEIKVVREDGKALDYQTAIIRYIGYIVSAFVICLGYFWVIWDEKKQAWHDKIAKTLVVKE